MNHSSSCTSPDDESATPIGLPRDHIAGLMQAIAPVIRQFFNEQTRDLRSSVSRLEAEVQQLRSVFSCNASTCLCNSEIVPRGTVPSSRASTSCCRSFCRSLRRAESCACRCPFSAAKHFSCDCCASRCPAYVLVAIPGSRRRGSHMITCIEVAFPEE